LRVSLDRVLEVEGVGRGDREGERESLCVCVCERERGRERERKTEFSRLAWASSDVKGYVKGLPGLGFRV